MNSNWFFVAVVLAGAGPVCLAAQTPPPPPAPRTPRAPRPDGRMFTFSMSGNRGRIGVLVNTVADSSSDKYGARIDGVTPGGPADKAGLKAGDIITKFNGTSLVRASSGNDDEDESRPGTRLIELAHQLDTGDTVRLEYRRGSDTKSVTLVADEVSYSMGDMGPMMRGFAMPKMPPMMMMGDGDGMAMCFGDAWCDLDLVTINPDLGDYFGTKDGVLVIKAPADSGLPLKSGDVILSIGGRQPTSPGHAMRILRSYDAGESVSIEIMRHQKRQTLSWTVPEADHWRRRTPRPGGEQSLWIGPDESMEHMRHALHATLDHTRQQVRENTRDQVQQMREHTLDQMRQMREHLRDLLQREQIGVPLLRHVVPIPSEI
jgi:hypothetical protein